MTEIWRLLINFRIYDVAVALYMESRDGLIIVADWSITEKYLALRTLGV